MCEFGGGVGGVRFAGNIYTGNNDRRREYPEDREVRVRYLGDLDIRCKMVGSKENTEWGRIADESEYRHPMAGFAYYQTLKRNRAERKRRHEEERAGIK